jgi:hypothetical protein
MYKELHSDRPCGELRRWSNYRHRRYSHESEPSWRCLAIIWSVDVLRLGNGAAFWRARCEVPNGPDLWTANFGALILVHTRAACWTYFERWLATPLDNGTSEVWLRWRFRLTQVFLDLAARKLVFGLIEPVVLARPRVHQHRSNIYLRSGTHQLRDSIDARYQAGMVLNDLLCLILGSVRWHFKSLMKLLLNGGIVSLHMLSLPTMSHQPSATQIQFNNSILGLSAVITTVDTISHALKTPFLEPISNTVRSLLTSVQVCICSEIYCL